jgi:ribonuclease HII
MQRAVLGLPQSPVLALIDGNKIPPGLPCPAQAIIGGDGKSLCIAAASIVAKVERDRYMMELATRWPGYGWERNAGYGTAIHLKGLREHGVTPHHRRSFAPVAALL